MKSKTLFSLVLLVFGKQSFSVFFKKVTSAETWLRRITGGSILLWESTSLSNRSISADRNCTMNPTSFLNKQSRWMRTLENPD